MKIVLLEDEPPALAHLTRIVERVQPDAQIVATFDTVASAREWFATKPHVDLVLSDIHLADGLVLPLFADLDVPVIFATAYDAHLLEAFRCAAVDYLLKPISEADVAGAFEKHRRLQSTLRRTDLVAVAELARAPRSRLLVRRGGELRAIAMDDVAYFVAEDKLTLLITHAGTEHVVDKTLAALERQLDPLRFFRANRATLVSAQAIVAFKSMGKGRLALTVQPRPKDDVVVPQEHGAAFRAWFDQ